jgi:di/tricarboxylate transporter
MSLNFAKPSHTTFYKTIQGLVRAYWKSLLIGVTTFVVLAVVGFTYVPAGGDVESYQFTETEILDFALDSAECLEPGQTASSIESDGNGGFTLVCEGLALNTDSWIVIGTTMTALLFLVNDCPADLTMIGATLFLRYTGIITQTEAWGAFSSNAVLTIGTLFIIAAALEKAGTAEACVGAVMGQPKTLFVAQLRLLIPVAILSAVMNNTPVVAVMIPIVERWSTVIGIHKSKFLMPMSFASLLGGMVCLFGTSANIVLAELYEDELGETLGVFEQAVVGIPMAICGILYMAIFSRFINANEVVEDEQGLDRRYQVVFVIDDDCPFIGRPVSDTGVTKMKGCIARSVIRKGKCYNFRDTENFGNAFYAGDQVHFSAVVQAIIDLRNTDGFSLLAESDTDKLGNRRRHRCLVEVVLDSACLFVGQNPHACGDVVREEYNAAIVSFRQTRPSSTIIKPRSSFEYGRPSNEGLLPPIEYGLTKQMLHNSGGLEESVVDHMRPSDVTANQGLRVGDCVLFETYPTFVSKYQNSNHFALVREIPGSRPPRRKQPMDRFRLVFAGAVLLGMVILASLEITNLFEAAVGASFLVLATKIISVNDAFRAINGRVVLAIAAIFGVGIALEKTAIAKIIADFIVDLLEPAGVIALLMGIFFITCILGAVVGSKAAVIVLFPICVQVQNEIPGSTLKEFVMTLMMAGSTSFLSPIGFQTNLMVFGPGGYTFSDFTKFGAGLTLLCGVIGPTLSHLMFGNP